MPRSSVLKGAAETRATTASVQDYLGAIYDLASSSGKPVIGARLAKHMGISAPAVTEAIHRMARGGYVKIGRGKQLDDVVRSHGHHPANVRDIRWIYLHMIEEYARHNGHADLIRERVDGVTGD